MWFDTQAKEAAEFYVAALGGDSKITNMTALHDTPSGDTGIVSFNLAGQDFMAISAGPIFTFNPSISFFVCCENQEEIDYYWSKLSAHPESEQCGWLEDTYGVSWQIVPSAMEEMMTHGTEEQRSRVTQEFLKMKKFDIVVLKRAYEGSVPQ